MTDDLAARLARRLSAVADAPVAVDGLRRLTAGASRETWSFTAAHADGTRRDLVLRRDPPGADRPDGMALEAASIAAADAAGVPVPPLVDSGTDATTVGAPYLVTAHVEGETLGPRLLREDRYAQARAGLAAELGRTLARIHAIPLDDVPGLAAADPVEHLRTTVDGLGEPLPTVEIALRWLERHRPEVVPEAVVHGDFRLGNLIVDETGLRAVLDWELVHRGDPREDLGWLSVKCWRFGAPLPVAGLGTLDELLDGYAEVAGERPDAEAVRWWQVHRTTWWALHCREMAERHLSGATPSVELAAIGRRVAEQEHDLLLALGIGVDEPPAVAARDASAASHAARDALAPTSDLLGRPSAADLVEAVRTYLREDVVTAGDERVAYLARVAANALAGVGRELALGPEMERRHRERLAALGYRDQAELARAIRRGAVAADDPALLAAVRAAVSDRLAVVNPRYATLPS
ncbi:phosphotransferase family protein [Actinomycetospora cinnamomea]|uniref:Aminoglycoside phosphotransferase (APT) family kinase protein n=1 Tax=Actinomycetospora cinnamomea TaxID=663609 RepID=A0A2U1F0X7_9PSEU|nr:phosphotransferase family protein [Actinomycetospora cinnamomea]PVZ05826.1 aminoglycoside phosphotransferase (APT) family kinase protein [Actinomycetospora cinnamomea]